MERKKLKKEIIVLLFLVGILMLILVGGMVQMLSDRSESDDAFSYVDGGGDQIFYESAWYVPKDSVESILILGIDKKEGASADREASEQADFLALLVFNRETESYQILHLNRDTMTEIPQTDAFGEIYGHVKGQLTLAHTYGDEDRVRCRNTVNTVESLLYGVNIDHYLSLTMDAVSIINDSIGGVTLQVMDDLTAIDPVLQKDATVTLRGEQALSYVQARGSLEDSSNLRRMERQKQYVGALVEQLRGQNVESLSDTVVRVSEYLVSDCTVDQLKRMVERIDAYSFAGMISPEGTSVKGAEFMEHYVDEDALKALVVGMFYEVRDESQYHP